jgi:hypothetical protein
MHVRRATLVFMALTTVVIVSMPMIMHTPMPVHMIMTVPMIMFVLVIMTIMRLVPALVTIPTSIMLVPGLVRMLRTMLMSMPVLVVMLLTSIMSVSANAHHPAGGRIAHRDPGALGTATRGTHQETSVAFSEISIDLIRSPSPPSGRVRFSEPQEQPPSRSKT